MAADYEAIVLRYLLKHGQRLERDAFLGEFPRPKRRGLEIAIASLERRMFVKTARVQGKDLVHLPDERVGDAMRRSSGLGIISDPRCPPIEELIPDQYATPFHIAQGDKPVNDHTSTYAFCRKKKKSAEVSCFVISWQNSVRKILLGDIAVEKSMIAKFLDTIDEKFGRSYFTREQIKTRFPRELVGNNQPTKAAIEYLCHEKYIVRHDATKHPVQFERTGKRRPVMSLAKKDEPAPEYVARDAAAYACYQ